MKIQTIIQNIKFELGLYKNNPLITKELNSLLDSLNSFICNPDNISLNDFLNANIRAYDVLINDCKETKQKRAYNFMLNFLISNR